MSVVVVAPTPTVSQARPPGFAPPNAPYGYYVMNGVTYAKPAPVRWVCFRRDRKLIFFLIIAIMAGIVLILLFCLANPTAGVTIMAAIIAITMVAEYLLLGSDCTVDPMVGTMQCGAL
jgi:hypothetical protein